MHVQDRQRDAGQQRNIVPLNDPRRQMDALGSSIPTAVAEVVGSGRYLFGRHVAEFEKNFAAYCGVRHCLTVANGTDALELALRALGCGVGSEIATVANAGMYASAAIIAVGGRPIFVDIDPASMNMAPECLARAVGPQTKVVIVTHLYGRLADIDALTGVARGRGLAVIEDCAQAHGAQRGGRRAGSWGDIGCYSFYPTKNLGALGDGGAVVTCDDALAAALQQLRQYGWTSKYRAVRPYGRNSRMDEIQAAVLQIKLPHLDAWNERRRSIMRRYRQAADNAVVVPDAGGTDHVAHLCVVRSPDRDLLRLHLGGDGVATDIHYPIADYRQTALEGLLPAGVSLPHTDEVVEEILTLPCFPELRDAEIERVCGSLARFAARVQTCGRRTDTSR
jgi:dTDP-3-amino-2,3,6-trideoxy-4-keto-D-glucose/dTDP-3-amino-3,4,6-trideoxy-alpha-D-glucose/dTDP-2,6-dideoxy-D-kanosamine transaminase